MQYKIDAIKIKYYKEYLIFSMNFYLIYTDIK